MDYGHRIEFGAFVTPLNKPPHLAVDAAVLAEQLGYDLVTYQDHPYQPRFHDTLTLLTWVAARTERVRLMANVHNLPLRPPAVLARAAASLDLLSGGRFDLGLGAGGFWDAIEAMGGRRLTPGESIDALREAIEIIRGVWDADNPEPLAIDGTRYRVEGAKRGPAPTRDIPIVVGGYRPRMLRFIGAHADGWVPSYGYLKPGDIPKANAAIDQAAQDAGRRPADIRRLLNLGGRFSPTAAEPFDGPPDEWVRQLTALALDDGVSVIILATDDTETMRQFAHEVIPAVRDAVTQSRRA